MSYKTLNEYIEGLIKFRDENNAGDIPVFYAKDSEGNGFDSIYFDPSIRYSDEEYEDFYCEEDYNDFDDLDKKSHKKIVIIN